VNAKRPFEYVKTIEIENERDCAIFGEGGKDRQLKDKAHEENDKRQSCLSKQFTFSVNETSVEKKTKVNSHRNRMVLLARSVKILRWSKRCFQCQFGDDKKSQLCAICGRFSKRF
jgi:hypothetical protein